MTLDDYEAGGIRLPDACVFNGYDVTASWLDEADAVCEFCGMDALCCTCDLYEDKA